MEISFTLEWHWWYLTIALFISSLWLPDWFDSPYDKDCGMFFILGLAIGTIFGHLV